MAHAAEIELKRVPGTRDVYTIGGPNHVVRVIVEPERMNAYEISGQDIRAALQLSNAAQPSGDLVKDNKQILVETGTYLSSAADVRRLVVGVIADRPIYMSDVARIEDGPDQPSRYVWTGLGPQAVQKGIIEAGEYPGRDVGGVQEAGRECGGRRTARDARCAAHAGHRDSRRREGDGHAQLR